MSNCHVSLQAHPLKELLDEPLVLPQKRGAVRVTKTMIQTFLLQTCPRPFQIRYINMSRIVRLWTVLIQTALPPNSIQITQTDFLAVDVA